MEHRYQSHLMYLSFAQAQAELNDIEPIDYFFAKEFTEDLASSYVLKYKDSEGDDSQFIHQQIVVFHLLVALSKSVREGHTCLPIKELARHSFGVKSDDTGVITHHGYVFPEHDELVKIVELCNIAPEYNKAIVVAQNCLYMRRNYLFEQELQQQLLKRMSNLIDYDTDELMTKLQSLFPPSDATEIDWQQVAVVNALNKRISVIAGGPGTGKTYTVTKLLAAIVMLNGQINISLVAPTGKAAQRLTESITNAIKGFEGQITQDVLNNIPSGAKTLHRFLGVIPNQLQFKHRQDNQIDCDVVILDEVSMVDLALMTRLFRALPEHCQVIMLGDADQLPSVALGSVLADIAPKLHPGYSDGNLNYLSNFIDSKLVANNFKQMAKGSGLSKKVNDLTADHLAFLYKSRRFDGEGGIGRLAKSVIEGNAELGWQLLHEPSDNIKVSNELTFEPDIEKALPRLVEQYYKPLLTQTSIDLAFEQLGKFRVLSAARKGPQGVAAINDKICQLLGKQQNSNRQLFHGMPIMVNENNYGLGLYNGDIGIVWQNNSGHLVVAFEDPEQGYRYVMPTRLPSYETVYAMTIHKTQGSEFGHVYMVLANQQDNKMLSRELLYTGITRAKQKLSLSTLHRVWFSGVESRVKRFSNLRAY